MTMQHARWNTVALILTDLVLTAVLFLTAFYVRFLSGWIPPRYYPSYPHYLTILFLATTLGVLFLNAAGAYEPRRTSSTFSDVPLVFKATVLLTLTLSAVTFFYRDVDFSRLMFLLFAALFFLGVSGERIALRAILKSLRRRGFNMKRLMIIGAGDLGIKVLNVVRNKPEFGYHVIGLLDDYYASERIEATHGAQVLGRIREINRVVERFKIDTAIIALPMRAYDKIARVVKKCEQEGIEVEIIPDFLKMIRGNGRIKSFDGLPVLSIRSLPTENFSYKVLKRLFDIAFSLGVLGLGAPLFAGLAIGVKFSSPGPIFFRQERIGINRRKFTIYKFRTMTNGSEKHDQQAGLGIREDPRATRLGRLLRKWSLDELPQFWNVLRGDMSIVGPRPERTFHAYKLKSEVPSYMLRHQVKTGITGWAQANGLRGNTSIKKRVEYDLFYIENWSFAFDLKIILMTLQRGWMNPSAC